MIDVSRRRVGGLGPPASARLEGVGAAIEALAGPPPQSPSRPSGAAEQMAPGGLTVDGGSWAALGLHGGPSSVRSLGRARRFGHVVQPVPLPKYKYSIAAKWSIWDKDDRTIVPPSQTLQWPYRCVGTVLSGTAVLGTGTLVGPRHVLTCAHVVDGKPDPLRFVPPGPAISKLWPTAWKLAAAADTPIPVEERRLQPHWKSQQHYKKDCGTFGWLIGCPGFEEIMCSVGSDAAVLILERPPSFSALLEVATAVDANIEAEAFGYVPYVAANKAAIGIAGELVARRDQALKGPALVTQGTGSVMVAAGDKDRVVSQLWRQPAKAFGLWPTIKGGCVVKGHWDGEGGMSGGPWIVGGQVRGILAALPSDDGSNDIDFTSLAGGQDIAKLITKARSDFP